jgi:hypothetical protein
MALTESVASLLASMPSFLSRTGSSSRSCVQQRGRLVIYIIRACYAAVLLWFAVGEAAAQTTTDVMLSSSKNPSAFGEFVSFFAIANSSTGPTPTGTVQFMDGPTNLGGPRAVERQFGFSPPLNAAALGTSSLSPGAHLITAVYSGDAQNAPATATLTQVVIAAVQPAPVPTLSSWQTAFLALLICVGGVATVRLFEQNT